MEPPTPKNESCSVDDSLKSEGTDKQHDDDLPKQKDEQPDFNRRESIRAKLREKEERLTRLVRSASGDSACNFVQQMATIQETLKQVEAEKSELELELDRLKSCTDDDDFLKEKMKGVQDGFMKQVERIQSLEDEVVAKKSEVEHLKDQLVAKLHRIVELEFDLETHDVHFTEYAAEQFKLGEEALAEIKAKEREIIEGDHSSTSLGSEQSPGGTKRKLSPKRAQKLISKLLSDLDILEARYKDEKLVSASQMEQLRSDNEDLRTKIHVLEKRHDGVKAAASEPQATKRDEQEDIAFLRKRVEVLEAKRARFVEETDKLKKQLKETGDQAKSNLKKADIEIDQLRLENDALKKRIESSLAGKIEKEPADRPYAHILSRIRESFDRIAMLEGSLEIKDRQLATVKKEVSRLRAKEIAHNGNAGGRQYSVKDAELMRNSIAKPEFSQSMGDGMSTEHSDAANAYVEGLQRQLQHAQQLLVKKDQELVIERAKSASTAAGLLARITELTGKKPSKNSKQVPLRFYL